MADAPGLDGPSGSSYNALHSTDREGDPLQAWITQFRKGLVELCIMATLRDEEAYGYQIVEKLGRVAGLEVTESTVYPVLARLARDRCVAVRTVPSPSGPPRRYYRLSEAGRRRLVEMIGHWQSIQNSVNHLTQGAFA
jgi:PadR family transcriptional regulator PadR